MVENYDKKQLARIYNRLPQRMRDYMSSPENTDAIWKICEEEKIPDKDIDKISAITGSIMLGVLPQDKFQETMQSKIEIKPAVAKKIADRIEKSLISPIESEIVDAKSITEDENPTEEDEEPKKSSRNDTYREQIE